MRLHWKKGSMMHKHGHHHLKRKHFKRNVLNSMFDKDPKKKHYKHLMKGCPSMLAQGHHGKWKHLRGHSSSDSDDSDHHHGKGKHFKGMRRWCMTNFDDGHHGKGGCMSGAEKSHHTGKGKHFKGIHGRSMSCSDERMQSRCMTDNERGHHHRRMNFMGRGGKPMNDREGHCGKGHQFNGRSMSCSDDEGMQSHCMTNNERGHHHRRMNFMGRGGKPGNVREGHHGKGHPFKGRSMSCSDDERMHGYCMSDNEGGHHRRRMHFMGRHGRPMTDTEVAHRGGGKHFRNVAGLSMSCSDDEGMHGCCMSDNEGGHHHRRRMHFMGRQGRPMTDTEVAHRGRGKPFRNVAGGLMSCSDDEGQLLSDNEGHHRRRMHFMGRHTTDMEKGCHGRGKHFKGMMHHNKGKHWMRGHGRRGFFADDSALVPICATEVEGRTETLESENAENQATETAEAVDEDASRTKDQGNQTSGIMEIVVEDQEALTAAIRIVNKFL